VLEQRVYLALRLASLGHHGLREPSEQSRRCGFVLACPGEAWKIVIILDDSPMRVASLSAHLIMVLRDLVLERRALLLQIEPRSFELSLSLPQLVHTWVGWDLCVRRSPMPIDRVRGSPAAP
jgi:hypothetical protein